MGTLHDTTGSGPGGSDAWTFSAQDKSFDYLADGETLTLTYTVQVDDGNGGVVTQPVTITVTGTNDTPLIASETQAGAITEFQRPPAEPDRSATADTATGTVTFTDVDLSDHHAVTITGVVASGITAGLPDNTTLKGWLSLGTSTIPRAPASAAPTPGPSRRRTRVLTISRPVNFRAHLYGAGRRPPRRYRYPAGHHHHHRHQRSARHHQRLTATGAITELAATTGSSTSNSAGGSIAFADPDLSDHHSATPAAPSLCMVGRQLEYRQD